MKREKCLELKPFRSYQIDEIKKGLMNGVNPLVYAKTCYNWHQMREIRLGLEAGIDISYYSDPRFSWRQMMLIRYALVNKLNIPRFSPEDSLEEMKRVIISLMID